MKIPSEVLAVLAACTIKGNYVVLNGQLDRALYTAVNKVLDAAGGKWDRKAKAHLFSGDAAEALEPIILTGEYRREKQDFGVFYTPAPLAAQAVEALGPINHEHTFLEPSAGAGALAMALRGAGAIDITCVEILPRHVAILKDLGFGVWEMDFLSASPLPRTDRILMNPPFAKMDDAKHFLHALGFLKPGGRIVAIMSAAVTFRDAAPYRQIRDLPGIQIDLLPENSFKESGTSVNTALVIYDKP